MEVFGIEHKEYEVTECLPPNNSFVIVDLYDTVSKKHKVKSAYFDNGVFWEDSGSKSQGIEHNSKIVSSGEFLFNWKVVKWAKQNN